MSTFAPALQSGTVIRLTGALPCEVCLDAGWVAWTDSTGGPCEACQPLGQDEAEAELA